jgi:arabinosyltransferase
VLAKGWNDNVEFYAAKIMDNEKTAANQHILWVDAGDVAKGYTHGGQYLQMKVGDSKPAFLAIANSPNSVTNGVLEFLVKSIPGSTAEKLNSLEAGTEVCSIPCLSWQALTS